MREIHILGKFSLDHNVEMVGKHQFQSIQPRVKFLSQKSMCLFHFTKYSTASLLFNLNYLQCQSYHCQIVMLLDLKIFANISGIKFYLIVIVHCVTLLTNKVEHLYVGFFFGYSSLLCDGLFLSSVHKFIHFGFFLLICRISL